VVITKVVAERKNRYVVLVLKAAADCQRIPNYLQGITPRMAPAPCRDSDRKRAGRSSVGDRAFVDRKCSAPPGKPAPYGLDPEAPSFQPWIVAKTSAGNVSPPHGSWLPSFADRGAVHSGVLVPVGAGIWKIAGGS